MSTVARPFLTAGAPAIAAAVGFLAIAAFQVALANLASPSPWERFLWGPLALGLAGLCFLVARNSPPSGG